MKKQYSAFLSMALIVLISFSINAQEINAKKQQKFVSKFMGAVNVQKERKVRKMISEEFKERFEGPKEEMLPTFFSGRFLNTGEFSKIPFDKILDIRVEEIFDMKDNIIVYKFILQTIEGPVETLLYLKATGKRNKIHIYPAKV